MEAAQPFTEQAPTILKRLADLEDRLATFEGLVRDGLGQIVRRLETIEQAIGIPNEQRPEVLSGPSHKPLMVVEAERPV